MGRLRADFLERVENFADRMLDVAEALEKEKRFRRIVDQISGCGTSPGANMFEADQAMTRKDFAKTVAIVVKELSEAKFWLRLVGRRRWIKPERLEPLLDETDQLLAIANTMIVRTRKTSARPLRP